MAMGRTGIGMLAAASVLAAAGCNSGHHTAKPNKQANKPSQEPVVYATDVPSPDGKRVAFVQHVGNTYLLEVGPAGDGPRRTLYRSAYLTTDVFWASPHLIAFGDGNEVNTVNVRTRHVRRIVVWASSFNISSDRRWIAWSKTGGPDTPDTVGVVPSTGGECLLVPRPSNRADSLAFFKPGVKRVFFLREPFSASAGQVGSGRIISAPMSSLRRAPASAC
jgi:hypothetical protein